MANWREQYQRMLRWRARVSDPMRPGEGREQYDERIADCLHAFFVSCHHLADWLVNDPSTQLTRTDTDFAYRSEWLGRCIDIANGSKHAVLTKGTITGGTVTSAISLSASVQISLEGSWFAVETDGQEHDAMRAADACIREWDDFLRTRGLGPEQKL